MIEFQEGGENSLIHKLPGSVKYPNIVLKRGFTGDRSLYDFYASFKSGRGQRVNGAIVLLSQLH